jgi:hypothetical protein
MDLLIYLIPFNHKSEPIRYASSFHVQLSLKTREARYEYFLGPNPGAKRGRNTRGVTADLTQDDRKQKKERKGERKKKVAWARMSFHHSSLFSTTQNE